MRRRTFIGACSGIAACSRKSAGPPVTLRIGLAGPGLITHLPLTLAQHLGFFADEQLEVELDAFPLGMDTANALRDGRIDVSCNQFSWLLQQDSDSAGLRGFVNLLRYPGYVMVASPSSRVRRIDSLAGKSVGLVEADRDAQFLLAYLLGKRNVGRSSVTVKAFARPLELVEAIKKGSVDAGVLMEPYVSKLESDLQKITILIDMRTGKGVDEAFGLMEFPGPVIAATIEWIGTNESTALRLVRALQSSLRWIGSHTASQVIEKLPVDVRQPDDEIYLPALVSMLPTFSPNGSLREDSMETAAQVVAYSIPGLAESTVRAADTFSTVLVDRATTAP